MIEDTDPLDPSGDSIDMTQTCWTREGEDWDRSDGADESFATFFSGSSPTSGAGSAARLDSQGEWFEHDFTTTRDIPDGSFALDLRIANENRVDEVTVTLDGTTVHVFNNYTVLDDTFWSDFSDIWSGGLSAGDHTLRFEMTGSGGDLSFDVIAPNDSRFNYNFDDTVTTVNGNNYLDGPEFFPELVVVELSTETRRDVTEATAEIDTNSTDANQYVELRIGSDAFDRANNATSASTTGGPGRSIDVNLGLSRYPDDSNPQNATPRYGYNGQTVNSYELTANPDAITGSGVGEAEVDAIVAQGSITGDRLEEAAELTSGGDALTRSIFAPFDVFSSMAVRSSERISFNNDE